MEFNFLATMIIITVALAVLILLIIFFAQGMGSGFNQTIGSIGLM